MPSTPSPYIGRFAPSPTGPLHAGSLVAALASWLDANAHGGQWLVRIEDIDPPRCQAGADHRILQQLAACGLQADQAPVWQSQRHVHYEAALQALEAQGRVYPCACSRKDIQAALDRLGVQHQRHQEQVYPGTCRHGIRHQPPRTERAWRLRVEASEPAVTWHDRRLGPQSQAVAQVVGDFVLRRADGLWSYQLAVVVDDALQGITHIVRGEDLADNTARQCQLQTMLGHPRPAYLHTPLVLDARGEKLSKQHGAPALSLESPDQVLAALNAAAQVLGLHIAAPTLTAWLPEATAQWAAKWLAR